MLKSEAVAKSEESLLEREEQKEEGTILANKWIERCFWRHVPASIVRKPLTAVLLENDEDQSTNTYLLACCLFVARNGLSQLISTSINCDSLSAQAIRRRIPQTIYYPGNL